MSPFRSRGVRLSSVLSFLVLPVLGCGARGEAPSPQPASDVERLADLEALYWTRVAEDRNRFAPADVEFMAGMIEHHAQAVLMTELVPERAADPRIHRLAARIARAQVDEIDLMRRWLEERGQEVPGDVHAHPGAHPGHLMPGMLTHAQLQGLAEARGADFDRLFLELMIEHHGGAVEMVRRLFATDGAGQDPTVFTFASDVQVDQATEIARMERMLEELTAPRPDR